MGQAITIIYDGECPFCSSYVQLLRLRDNVGKVELVDARSDNVRVREANRTGYDLDSGMMVAYGGHWFFGQDAIHLLVTLSGPGGAWNSFQRIVFSSPDRAAKLYPLLASARHLYLRLAGKSAIRR